MFAGFTKRPCTYERYYVYLFNTSHILGTVLGAGNSVLNKTDQICTHGADIPMGKGRQ
jgi:hypothetical protein